MRKGNTAGRYADGDIGEELSAELDRELEDEDGDWNGDRMRRLPISGLL
jgi:hypothetical protein